MRFTHRFFVVAVLFFVIVPAVRADSTQDKIDELRRKIEELTRQAEQYRGNVLAKQHEANTLKRQIDILNNQILALESQIGATDRRITASGLEIDTLEGQIYSTQKDISQRKQAIAEAMTYLYERDQTNVLAGLLQNASISEFTDEAQQVESLNLRLKDHVLTLKQQKIDLETKRDEIARKKAELEELQERQHGQRTSLSTTKSSKNKLLADTKGQESRYQKLLNDVERQKAAFFDELRSLESAAIGSGTIITHITATSVPPRGTKIFQKPYRDSHYVTQGYGMTAYAKRGVYGGAPHNGRDIVNGYGSSIYSIGAGKILAFGTNSGWGNWVAVQHDNNMVSLYAHMSVFGKIKVGDRATADSVLGYEGSTGTSTGSHLHLSLYRDFFTYTNPKNGQLYFNYFNGSVDPFDYM